MYISIFKHVSSQIVYPPPPPFVFFENHLSNQHKLGWHIKWKICRSLIPVALILSTANCLWKTHGVGGVQSRDYTEALKERQWEC